jgi:altronate dehydratase
MTRGFLINKKDTVITLLDTGKAGDEIVVVGEKERLRIRLREDIKANHKAACRDIREGEQVIKYGFPIGFATRDIRVGEWVHTHNIASSYDEERSHLDLETGASLDRRYE